MDFDGDGRLDLVSGSYDPGALYLFRGLDHGKFAAREVINDKSGKPILKVPDQKDTVESFGSWMTTADWDDDGDLDILVGTFDGMIFLRRNEGTRTRPEYATANEWVMVASKRVRVPSGEHANPVVADWDGDGRWDIVTGSADGGVYWYRNIGRAGRPEFDKPVALVARHEGLGYGDLLGAGHEPRPGIRAQIAVVDYDGDGKLDVLLGDYYAYLHVKQDLSPEARREFKAARARQAELIKELRGALDDVRERFKAMMKGVPRSEWQTPENSAKWQKLYKEMRESPEYRKASAEYETLKKELLKYVDAPESRPNSPATVHGYVWLYRRK